MEKTVNILLKSLKRNYRLYAEEIAAAASGLRFVKDNEQVVNVLIKALGIRDHWVRMSAASALGDIGNEKAIIKLERSMYDPEWPVQIRAAEAMGNIGGDDAVEYLKAAFRQRYVYTSNAEIGVLFRSKAAKGLTVIGNPELLAELEECLVSRDREMRLAAAVGLSYRKKPGAMKCLLEEPIDKLSFKMYAVIEGLELCETPEAIAKLKNIASMRSIPVGITRRAKKALMKINDPTVQLARYSDNLLWLIAKFEYGL